MNFKSYVSRGLALTGQIAGRLRGIARGAASGKTHAWAFRWRDGQVRPMIMIWTRKYWMFGVGALSALLAFWATQQYAENRVAQERDRLLPKGGFVEVLVAARDLTGGDVASPTTIAVRRIPKEWMLPDSLRPVDFEAVRQRVIALPLRTGHPLTLAHFRSSGLSGSALRLDPGYRAISIPVDEVSSVGGLIQPGDHVDLWAAPLAVGGTESALVSVGQDRQPRGARLVAENLRVIATGLMTERTAESGRGAVSSGATGYASMTLAVPASVAATVLGGQFQGRLGLALRASDERDGSVVAAKGAPRIAASGLGPVEILVGGLDGGLQ